MITLAENGENHHSGSPTTPGEIEPASIMTLSLLGAVELSGPVGRIEAVGKFACILGFLASSHGLQKTRDEITTAFWSDKDDAQAKASLRQVVLRIRQSAVADAFAITDHSVRLIPKVVNCDLWRFKSLVQAGSDEALAAAIDLYRGPFLANITIKGGTGEEWLYAERAIWEQAVADACVRLGELDLASGNAARAITTARKAIQIDSFREDAHRILMRGLAARDRRSEALRHYDALYALLERELDSEPDELTQALAVTMKQESLVSTRTALGIRLEADTHLALEYAAQRAIGMSGAGLLVVEGGPGSLADSAVAFADSCLNLSRAYGGRLLGEDRSSPCFWFHDVRSAVAAGLDILRAPEGHPGEQPDSRPNQLRLGVHVVSSSIDVDAPVDDTDISVTRHLCRLAEVGQMVLSVDAREHIVDLIDVELHDQGERPLPYPSSEPPLRSFSVTSPSPQESLPIPQSPQQQLLPMIAVIPFNTLTNDPEFAFLGDIIADEMIVSLSRSTDVSVISRMSTAALRARAFAPQQIHGLVNADYLASGQCYVARGRAQLTVEFTEARSAQVMWVERFETDIRNALVIGGIVEDFVLKVKATIMLAELKRSRSRPLEDLSDSTLLLGAIATMHQLSLNRFETSRAMLDAVIERAPDHATPHAWLGMYLLLRSSQGWSTDIEADARLASDSTKRALDLDPGNSLALCVNAHVHTQFMKDFDSAARLLELAIESNPSNGLAWLFKSTLHAFRGQGSDAMASANSAMRLSPLDPRRWFYDSLAATAALGASDYEKAIMLAKRSIRANATHSSSFRALAIAQSLAGRVDEARQTVTTLMKLQPALTTTAYRSQHPSGVSSLGALWADALRQAGVPE